LAFAVAEEVKHAGIREADGFDLFQAAHSELLQAPVAAFGVGEFGDRGALSEGEHLGGAMAWRVGVAAAL